MTWVCSNSSVLQQFSCLPPKLYSDLGHYCDITVALDGVKEERKRAHGSQIVYDNVKGSWQS